MATTFPTSIQSFPTMLDVTSTDGSLVAQVQSYIQAGNITAATQVLQTIPNYSQKFITALLMNTAFDTEVALENYYLQRWSPAYVVSATQPLTQETGDYWFQVIT